jgi:DNA-binding MarR family transcriptional regulator
VTSREQAISNVLGELGVVVRRANSVARRTYADLTIVEQSLLSHIGSNPGCRATDIASTFQLNRSTVSRQLAALHELGLVEYGTDAARGQSLTLTASGHQRLADSHAVQGASLTERLADWSSADISAFAGMLARYNSDG